MHNKRHPKTRSVRVRRVGTGAALGFPFGLSLISLCSGRGPTAHFCAKGDVPFIHAGTGAGTGVEAHVAGLNDRIK